MSQLDSTASTVVSTTTSWLGNVMSYLHIAVLWLLIGMISGGYWMASIDHSVKPTPPAPAPDHKPTPPPTPPAPAPPAPTTFNIQLGGKFSIVHSWEGLSPFTPLPIPPNPNPNPPVPPNPVPPIPAPIAAPGLRVLMLYESSQLSKLPVAQSAILYDTGLRTYLDSTTPVGKDGKTHEYRIWDKDVNPAGDDQIWQDALKRPHATIPWILISNGTTGFEGPLPADPASTKALIQKYEVSK